MQEEDFKPQARKDTPSGINALEYPEIYLNHQIRTDITDLLISQRNFFCF